MSIGAVLDTAIGLIFVFLILGLMASAAQEALAAITKLRGKYLVEGISRLLAGRISEWGKAGDRSQIWWPVRFIHRIWFALTFKEYKAPTYNTWRALRYFFGRSMGHVDEWGSELFKSVMTHPLIWNASRKSAPAYVTRADFVSAVVYRLRGLATATAVPKTDAGLRLALDQSPSSVPAPTSPTAVPPSATPEGIAEIERQNADRALFEGVRDGIAKLPDGPAKRALTTILAEAGGRFDELESRLGRWFDDAMERVSGVYKRVTQYAALAFGLAVAIVLNVDSVQVASHLWTDRDARAAVAAAAEAFVTKAAEAAAEETDETAQAAYDAAVIAERDAAEAVATAPTPENETALKEARTKLEEARVALEGDATVEAILARFDTTATEVNQQLAALPIPIGRVDRCGLGWWRWLFSGPSTTLSPAECSLQIEAVGIAAMSQTARASALAARVERCALDEAAADVGDPPTAACSPLPQLPDRSPWLFILGWLLTALAVSLGAPFWFDLLKKFIHIRAAGSAPDERIQNTAGQ